MSFGFHEMVFYLKIAGGLILLQMAVNNDLTIAHTTSVVDPFRIGLRSFEKFASRNA